MKHDSKIVSVIIACYNQERFIKEAIDSILKQTYSNWECLLIDDGSTDGIRETIHDYLTDGRIKYIYQQNSGVSFARNTGIAKSSGDYIQFLDGDDILQENKLQLQVDFLEQHPYVDVVYGSTRYFHDGDFNKKYVLNSNGMVPTIEIHHTDQDQAWVLAFRNLTTICAPLYRKSVFTTDHTFKNIIFEDWYFHLECALKGKIFHFERMAGSASFVRISKNSQMNRHRKVEEKSPDIFPMAIKRLFAEYNYPIPIEEPVIERKAAWKKGMELFTPPIVIKMLRIFKTGK